MHESIWQVEVDSTTSADWSQMLDLFNDASIYQTWAYGAVRWGTKNLSHLVLKRRGEVLGIAQLRIIRPTKLKFGMAYLRWGPLCERRERPLDPEVTGRMARALEEEYMGRRKLLLHIQANAFKGSKRAAIYQSAFCRFKQKPSVIESDYRTLILDLAPGLEDLRRKLDQKWRNQLSRSERNSLVIVVGSGSEEFRAFCMIYEQMQKRKTFQTTVDIKEFGRIQECLPESQRMQILICKRNDTPVAGLVASAMGDSGIYLLGATCDDGLNSKGAYLLQWTLIRWLKEKGVSWYDLGGIDPEHNPGVYHFKKGLSGLDVCHISPMVASNALSAAIVKTSLAIRNVVHGSIRIARTAPSHKQSGTGS